MALQRKTKEDMLWFFRFEFLNAASRCYDG